MQEMEILFSICLGLGLSAACGFRIFVPMLVISAAANAGQLDLASSFEWMGTTPALVAFASATLLEIGAYYTPWLDNLLDTVAAPTAVVAGVVATASQVSDMDPLMGWTVAVIGGGGIAGVIQGVTTAARQFSLFATGGFGNPIVSTAEGGISLLTSILAMVVPVFTMLAILALTFYGVKKVFFRKREQPPAALA